MKTELCEREGKGRGGDGNKEKEIKLYHIAINFL